MTEEKFLIEMKNFFENIDKLKIDLEKEIKRTELERDDIDTSLKWYVLSNEHYINKPYIIKHSKNIIDLIEVGDYVNGEHIDFITNKNTLVIRDNINFFDKYKSISSIVTKEQFKNIKYKI